MMDSESDVAALDSEGAAAALDSEGSAAALDSEGTAAPVDSEGIYAPYVRRVGAPEGVGSDDRPLMTSTGQIVHRAVRCAGLYPNDVRFQ